MFVKYYVGRGNCTEKAFIPLVRYVLVWFLFPFDIFEHDTVYRQYMEISSRAGESLLSGLLLMINGCFPHSK